MNGINNDDIYEFFDNKDIYDLKDEKILESKDEFSEYAQREPGDVEKLLDKLNEGEKISRWVCLQEPEETDEDFDNNKTDSRCYLTSACMKYLREKFDDNCYELTVLRWFRDNFVTNEDIKHYYRVAPSIVEEINKEEKGDLIYDYIYDNVVDYCVTEIEKGNYKEAYKRYKESILALEAYYIRYSSKQAIRNKSRILINSNI